MRRRLPIFLLVGMFSLLLMAVGTACVSGADALDGTPVEAILLPPPQVPPPTAKNNQHIVVHLEAVEKEMEVAPGVTITAWTFNGFVPGPLIRVRVGDTVEVHLKNSTSSTMTHNIDLHAVNGPGGGAGATSVAPGEEKAFAFKAKSVGLFTYHCAAGIVADHSANGMYGGIMVDPAVGNPDVDKEFYIGQSDIYTTDDGLKGHHDLDSKRLIAEDPSYVVFNGNTKSTVGDNALMANVGDTVRIYFVDGGPNKISSFHVIGEIFDKVWEGGTMESPPRKGIQTTLVPPGGSAITEFYVDVPGDYKLVDHAISRVSKGAVGTLHVMGKDDPDVFRVLGKQSGAAAASHEMTAPTPTPFTIAAGSGPVKVEMSDSIFTPSVLQVAAGQAVTFSLPNLGKLPHNMRIADASGSYDDGKATVSDPEIINAGKTGTVTWTPKSAGTYQFRCDVHPDVMKGTIVVQ